MMNTLFSGLLLAASASAITVAVGALAAPPYQVRLTPAEAPGLSRTVAPETHVSDSVIRLVIARAPFRLSRSPAGMPYNPEVNVPAVVPESSRVPRPVLNLSGIIWEPEPRAVIEGFPGVEGAKVIRPGEVVNGLRVKRIERERVVITGLDTTWSLSVREPWK